MLAKSAFLPAITMSCALPMAGAVAQQPHADQITREQYVQHAAEAAGRRFDMIDSNHAGVLTREQLRTWAQQHHHGAQNGAQNWEPPG